MTLELAYQLEADLAEAVEAIRADTVSGPITLARRGADAILRLTDKAHYERPLHIWMEVQGLARALLAARPDCMPLANFASETVQPLRVLYGRGKDEGARMRADLRARTEEWLAALDARAARIDAVSRSLRVVSAAAIASDGVCLPASVELSHYVVGGREKFIPPNYEFPGDGFHQVPLEAFDGFVTGDTAAPISADEVRKTIASLRFATTLL